MKKNKKNWLIASLLCFFAISVCLAFIVRLRLSDEKQLYMIYIPKIIDEDNDFWKLLLEGVRMSAEERGIRMDIVAAETEEDFERQNELILWAIEQKPDAILLTPSHVTKTTPAAVKVEEAGIPLILIDSIVEGITPVSVIATNNERAGAVVGEYLGKLADDQSQIAVVGHVQNSSTAIEREAGVRKGLAEHEKQIVDVVFCDSDYSKAYTLMEGLIEQYPGINLVAGLNEYSSVGAARAIQDKGLEGKIKFVGIDSSLEEIQMLEKGIFEGIVIQNPFKMGYLGVEVADKFLKGEKVLSHVDSGSELITRDNIYTEENQKLLFPFKEE